MSTKRQSGIGQKNTFRLNKKTREAKPAIPAWRKIEALQEKMALRNELTDIWSETPEFDDSMFSLEGEQAKRIYSAVSTPIPEATAEGDIEE